jgi:hypothetical protein
MEHSQECDASSGSVDTQPGTLRQHVAAGEDAACQCGCCALGLLGRLAISVGDRYTGRLGQGFERMEVGWQCWTAQELVAVRTQDTNLRRGQWSMSGVPRHTCALRKT